MACLFTKDGTAIQRQLSQYVHVEAQLLPPVVAEAVTRFEIESHKAFSHFIVLKMVVKINNRSFVVYQIFHSLRNLKGSVY